MYVREYEALGQTESTFDIDRAVKRRGRRRHPGTLPSFRDFWARMKAALATARAAPKIGAYSTDFVRVPSSQVPTASMYPLGAPQEALQFNELAYNQSLPLRTHGPAKWGPVIIRVAGRINLHGSIRYGKPTTKITLSQGEQGKLKGDFENNVYSSFGTIKFKGSIEPGKLSKAGVEIGTELFTFEVAANADLSKPFQLTFKPQTPIKTELKFGEWTFKGKIQPSFEIYIIPDPRLVAALARGGVSVARAVTRVLARGLLFGAGEAGAVTTLGAVAAGAGIAAGAIAWLGLTLYMIGKAHREGRGLAVGYKFSGGYATMLAALTSRFLVFEDTPAGRQRLWDLLSLDWKTEFEEQGKLYVEKKDSAALDRIPRTGEAAVLQDWYLFTQLYGPKAWGPLAQEHRRKYGQVGSPREEAYRNILERQVKEGKPIGIPLVPTQ